MDRNFGGVIWTNHALERLVQHGIKQGDAWATFRNPQQSRRGQKGWVFYRTYPSTAPGASGQKIEVVASQNEKKQWVILSVWSRPVYPKTQAVKLPSWWDRLLERVLWSIFGRFRKL